jgi:hypothetical protein
MPERIVIIANKSWEVDPLVAVLINRQARPSRFPDSAAPAEVVVPFLDGRKNKFRARLTFKSAKATAEVWCIQDLMDSEIDSSNSEEKARVLSYVGSTGPEPDLVIAFGTGATASETSYNGCVVIGSNAFVYDPYRTAPNPQGKWSHPEIGKLVDSVNQQLNAPLFSALGGELRSSIEARFLPPPISGADLPGLILSAAQVAVSVVNITDRNSYAWADAEAVRALLQVEPRQLVGSLDSTHGVIRLALHSPQYLFISGITNRLGYFRMELAPRFYAQNLVASHNAAIALAWMIPVIME